MHESKKINREHAFDYELATIVGIEKAILLKNIAYWCSENRRRNNEQYYSNGIWWTDESLSSLATKYPYMKRPSIGRWMQELEESGWIKVEHGKWKNRYSIGIVLETWDSGGDWESILSHFETSESRLKMGRKSSQNGTKVVSKWDESRLKMGQAPILDSEGNVDLNGETNIQPPKGGNIVENPDEPKKEIKAQRIDRESLEALTYLNTLCRRNFSATPENLKFGRGRLQGGATLETLKLIVEWAAATWKGQTWNGKSAEFYWRPATLFQAEKFDHYRQQAEMWKQGQGQNGKNGSASTGDIKAMRASGIYNQKQ